MSVEERGSQQGGDAPCSPADGGSIVAVRLSIALERLVLARRVTEQFLADLTPAEWFWSPPQYPTHVAWQVMHIAASQYSLCFRRIRGVLPEDEAWFPAAYVAQFGLGSQPQLDPTANPSLDEIRRTFDGVYQRVLAEAPTYAESSLAETVDPPHPVFQTKLGSLEYASHHEGVHAGQIAMLRRLMHKKPLR